MPFHLKISPKKTVIIYKPFYQDVHESVIYNNKNFKIMSKIIFVAK